MRVKKVFVSILLIVIIILPSFYYSVEATVDSIIDNMKNVNDDLEINSNEGIPKVINIIIGLLQVAGSGISIIVVTIQGIKYIVASVEEKADIKKQAIPIVIGCILLFGAVNLMAGLEEWGKNIS